LRRHTGVTTEIRRIAGDDWRLWRQLRLEALSEAPYAFSSSLADWQGNGDREQRWRDRLDDVEYNLVAYLDGVPAGMVSGVCSPEGQPELISMWVAPFARGRGVGDALVEAVIRHAAADNSGDPSGSSGNRSRNPSEVVLSVMAGNDHAIAMYMRHGFVDAGEDTREAAPGERNERRMMRLVSNDSRT
jgi:ribosomal protein S18 acetylase RimI-like enzyme